MNKGFILSLAFMICAFSACEKDSFLVRLPSSLANKSYDYEMVKKSFCSSDSVCVSVDSNSIVFVDKGFLFIVFKGYPATKGEDCWLEIDGVKKILPYRDMFLVLIGQTFTDRPDDISGTSELGSVYLVDNIGRYAKIGSSAIDIATNGDDILTITNDGIKRYVGKGGIMQFKEVVTKQVEGISFSDYYFFEQDEQVYISSDLDIVVSSPAVSFVRSYDQLKIKLSDGQERPISDFIQD